MNSDYSKKQNVITIVLLSPIFIAPVLSHAEIVTVFAAASLNNAIHEIAQDYEAIHPNDKIQTSFAASSTLAKQIQLGAPAQIFISADEPWMDALAKSNLLIEKSRVDLLANQLVLITPKDQPLPVIMDKSFHLPLAFTGKICLGNPDSVPAGKYAKQSLITMGWWDGLQSRVVPTEDVRSALAFVARGECPLGAVYTTDAMISSDKVKIIGTLPNNSHSPIVYPLALLKNTENQTKASTSSQFFWQYLQQPTAQKIFHKYGFSTVKH